MRDHIKIITKQEIKKKQRRMKKTRLIFVVSTLIGLTISLWVFHFWGAILVAALLLLTIFYTIPVKKVHLYPEEINRGLQKKLHTLYEVEKGNPSLDILVEEEEIKESLEALHNNVLDE